jgi:hypothetical protein
MVEEIPGEVFDVWKPQHFSWNIPLKLKTLQKQLLLISRDSFILAYRGFPLQIELEKEMFSFFPKNERKHITNSQRGDDLRFVLET